MERNVATAPHASPRSFAPVRTVPRTRPTLAQLIEVERWSGNAPLWFAGGMALGIVQYATAPREIAWAAVLGLLIFAVGAVAVARERTIRSWLALALLAVTLGMAAAKWAARTVDSHMMVGEATTRVSGIVERRTVDARGRTRYTIRVLRTDDPTLQFAPDRARLFVSAKHDPIAIGSGIEALARLRQPSGPAMPGGYDFAYRNYFQGLGAQGFVLGRPTATQESPAGTGFAVERLRSSIAGIVRSRLDGTSGGVAAALLVGDRRGIPEEMTEALRVSGLAHVLAISGLHMALVSGFVLAALRLGFAASGSVSRLPARKIAATAALAVASCYLLLSGFGVSAQRAFIMLAVMLVAVLFDRPALTMRNVGIAALIVMALNPHEVLGPGFQMSFGATAALIATYAAWKRVRTRLDRRERLLPPWLTSPLGFFVGLAVTSVIAGTATGVFAAYHFHRIAPYGLLANLLAMPLVTFVTMPSGVLTALAMPFGLEAMPLAVMGWSIERVLEIAEWVANMRSPIRTGSIGTAPFVLAVVGLFLLFALRTRLAIVALVPITLSAFTIDRPNVSMLVAERGEMTGIVRSGAIRIDKARPNRFLADQWSEALLLDAAGSGEGGFACGAKDEPCTITARGLVVRTVRLQDDLGAACDEADIIVTSFRTSLTRCRSGAYVLNAIETNRRGAATVDLDGLARASAGEVREETRSRLAGVTDEVIASHIRFALPDARRPWTAHRYAVLKRRKRASPPAAAGSPRPVHVGTAGGGAPAHAR